MINYKMLFEQMSPDYDHFRFHCWNGMMASVNLNNSRKQFKHQIKYANYLKLIATQNANIVNVCHLFWL